MPQPCTICGVEMVEERVLVCRQSHMTLGPKIGSAIQSCPTAQGSIWVHVADELGVGVGGIPVSHPSGGTGKSTDATGFVSFDPLDEGTAYSVTIGPVPDKPKAKYFTPKDVTAKAIPVSKGQITSVEFKLERMGQLKVVVREVDGEVFVKDVSVSVSGPSAEGAEPPGTLTTAANGTVEFPRLRVAAGNQVKIALAEDDKKNYVVDVADTQSGEVKADATSEVVFKLIPMAWVKIQLRDKIADAIKDEAKRKQAQPVARIQVKTLEAALEEKPTEGRPEAIEFAMKKKAGAVCALQQILIDGDDCYEFVEAQES